jgi:NADH-quinone oxidoreductase subunit L
VTPPGWPPFYGKILWGGLLLAALGTAFYMWRLYFLVFSGEERSEPAKQAHESPWSMTSALVVLAFFATVIGVIGAPHLEGTHLPNFMHALHDWLEPSTTHGWYIPAGDGAAATTVAIANEASDGVTLGLMGLALAIGALGIGLAWMFYGRGPSPSVAKLVEGPLAGLYEASKNKLWVDEIYDAIIVKPFRIVARGLYEIADRFIIDTVAVNGAAFVVGLVGRLSRWIQNGQVQRYLAGLVIGAAAVFFVTDCHRKPSFDYEIKGEQLHLHAAPGAGVVAATAKLHWHLDGNADCSFEKDRPGDPTDITVRTGDVGGKVVLCVDDAVSHEMLSVSRTIREQEDEPAAKAANDEGAKP